MGCVNTYRYGREKISWGQPALILECKEDKRCPRCGARVWWPEEVRFDIGYENRKFFGAICFNCGWTI